MRRSFWYIILGLCIVSLDRVTKSTILRTYYYPVTSWLHFKLSFNRGISWGIFNGSATLPFVCITILIGLFILMLFKYTRERYRHHYPIMGEIVVLAGACSNFFDRLIYHGVIDFIIFSYNSWVWPSFNVADAAIVCGALYMILINIRELYASS